MFHSYCDIGDIPSDATDVEGIVQYGYIYYVIVQFKSSSVGLARFASRFCDGVLHQGYDPYATKNFGDWVEDSRLYLIKLDAQYTAYLSSSPNTPDTVWGNRCQPPNSVPYQIRISQIGPDLYAVKADAGHYTWGCNVYPCGRQTRFSVVRLMDDFPLTVYGLVKLSEDNNQYFLLTNEVCLEFDETSWALGWEFDRQWHYLNHAVVEWFVDGQSQGLALVTDHGNLVRLGREYLFPGFDYCLMQDWTPGMHEMQLKITTTAGQQMTYQWSFYVKRPLYANSFFDSAN